MAALLALSLLLTLEPQAPFLEASPMQRFVQAGAAFRSGDLETACTLYQALLDEGFDHGELHYNYGNALLQHGQLGQSIVHYLHALSLMPRNEDVRANLAFARSQTKDALAPPTPSPILQALFFWHYSFSTLELLHVVVGVNVMFWLLLAIALWWRLLSRPMMRAALVTTFVLLMLLTPSWLIHTLAPTRIVVVTSERVPVYAGISTSAPIRFWLHDGAEARLLAMEDNFVRLALSDGNQGWIERKDIDWF